ncbi:hypothetical protein [Cupriavidus gilardii]|uniref:hypothetical protein n=1 Tax=Cupriavidus gilardii TaxID=82541 RepID=UPI001580884D|nr:hypothetical protein [Cupriavidus gilardii]MCT9073748.1 hypothetical protein [Cupriavidus gilardii]QKS64613.1 hypothetical protein FOB47_22900 [Cupriavidus gilardii]
MTSTVIDRASFGSRSSIGGVSIGHRSGIDRASMRHRYRAHEWQSVASTHHPNDARARCATTRDARSMRDARFAVAMAAGIIGALVAALPSPLSRTAALRFDAAASRDAQRAPGTHDRSSLLAAKPCCTRLCGEHAGSPSCLRRVLARACEGSSSTSRQAARAHVGQRVVGMSTASRCEQRGGSVGVSSRHAMRVSTARRACHCIDAFVIAKRAHSMACFFGTFFLTSPTKRIMIRLDKSLSSLHEAGHRKAKNSNNNRGAIRCSDAGSRGATEL